MRSTLSLISVVVSMIGATFAAVQPTSFVLVGDSTTAPAGGWGDGFCGSTSTGIADVAVGTGCFNTAHPGATAASFITGGWFATSLAAIKGEVAKGRRALVTIQFGHNDQKVTTPAGMGVNLTSIVQQVRAAGGEPVMVTSLTRRVFNPNGTLQDSLAPYAAEAILISQQQKTHLLDLHASSMKYVEAIGATAAHRLNLISNDTTHLNPDGSIVFGRMVADLFTASYPNQLPIVANPALSFNISHGIASF